MVSGPESSGRTALLHSFTDHVARRNGLVLTANGSRFERDIAGGLLCQLMSDPAIPRTARDAATRFMGDGRGADPGVNSVLRPELIHTAREVAFALAELASRNPVVLVIDDVEQADEVSLLVLRYIQRRIVSSAVMVVISEVDPPDPEFTALRGEFSRLSESHRVRIASLTLAGVHELLTKERDSEYACSYAIEFHRATAGNPRLVRALIADQDRGQGLPTGITARNDFRDALLTCVHRGDPIVLEVARAAATLGCLASPARIRRLIDRPTEAINAALTCLSRMGVLQECRFLIDAGRTTVLDDLPPGDFEKFQRRAAMVLFQDGASPLEIAERVLAGGVPCEAWAVPVLRAAADVERAAGRPAAAATMLETALTGVDCARDRIAVLTALATVLFDTSPSQMIRLLPELHGAFDTGDLGTDELAQLFRFQLWHGYEVEAHRTHRTLESAVHSATGPEPQLLGTRYWSRWIHPGTELRSSSKLSWDGVPQKMRSNAAAILRRSRLRRGPVEHDALAVGVLLRLGDVDEAVQWCEMLYEDAVATGSTRASAVLTCVKAEIALFRGQGGEAWRHAHDALEALPPACWGTTLPAPLALSAVATVLHSPSTSPADILQVAIPDAARRTWHWLSYLRARGAAHLAAGRPRTALAEIEACGMLAIRWKVDLPALIPWRNDLAEAHLALGETDRVQQLIALQSTRPTSDVGHVQSRSLLLYAMCRDGGERLVSLREAADSAAACGDQLTRCRALAALSVEHYSNGEGAIASAMAVEALGIARDCEIEALGRSWLEGAPSTADPMPHFFPASDLSTREFARTALSDAESRVAKMAADGLSNREISRSLYITVSTVEQHLTRSYRKLAIRSRSELRGVVV
nr:AntN [Pseudonocardia antarctica]